MTPGNLIRQQQHNEQIGNKVQESSHGNCAVVKRTYHTTFTHQDVVGKAYFLSRNLGKIEKVIGDDPHRVTYPHTHCPSDRLLGRTASHQKYMKLQKIYREKKCAGSHSRIVLLKRLEVRQLL